MKIKNNYSTKAMSILLAIVMLLGMTPIGVFAADVATDNPGNLDIYLDGPRVTLEPDASETWRIDDPNYNVTGILWGVQWENWNSETNDYEPIFSGTLSPRCRVTLVLVFGDRFSNPHFDMIYVYHFHKEGYCHPAVSTRL